MSIKKIVDFLFVILLFSSLLSCVKENFDDSIDPDTQTEIENEPDVTALLELQPPVGFEFKTHNEVRITINDNTPNVRYDVYAYNDEVTEGEEMEIINDEGQPETIIEFESDFLNYELFSGIPAQGRIEHMITVPSYFSQLYLRRKEGSRFSSRIIEIENGVANYNHVQGTFLKSSRQRLVEDFLFCVNGAAELFQVDPLNGDLTFLSEMPMGSFTAAIDQANGYLYSIGRNNPFPLNRYDIQNDSWQVMGNVGRGGPRLDFNTDDGLLYFSTGAKLYTIDPNNANTLSNWDIEGLHRTGGGDLAFAEDGTLFLCSFSGLYRLELDENSVYQSTRISGEDLPFNPTSMTFDSNNDLWLANNGANSNLIIMDTQTGGFQYNYGPDSSSGVSFGRTINDLTTFRVIDEQAEDPDTDGDGITDSNDEFPDDADKAFEQFTPSKFGWGTLAFEDLWPFIGDYDFNDTAVNFRFVAILNAQNEAVQLDLHYTVTSDGAGLVNGFGIELETIAPNQVASVTGVSLMEDYVTLAANGIEEGQDNAVVVVFDNHETIVGIQKTVSINFTDPIPVTQLGTAPFNPFLIVGKNRAHEIHLPNRNRTTLGTNIAQSEVTNADTDGNFATDTGLPWAIYVVHNFRVPRERVSVNRAYNFFVDWAQSGGTVTPDWYKDNPGYRNEIELRQN